MTSQSGCTSEPAGSDLKAEYRSGQVFLTWREGPVPPGTTFNVYAAATQIDSADVLASATKVGQHIEPRSGRDWWQDPASFDKTAAHAAPAGFVIEAGQPPIDPSGGLFVYTVAANDPAKLYFAVTAVRPDEREDATIEAGRNSLARPVACQCEPIQAIWQGAGQSISPAAGRGLPLVLDLHCRGGGIPSDENQPNFLLFGDATMGWRAGLAFKFTVTIRDGVVYVIPNDRAWTGGRPQSEAKDARNDCPAVNTWWLGTSDTFYKSANDPKRVVHNYTERWVLAVLHWAQTYLATDRPATYVAGGSMGASGAVAMCLHFPREFAAAWGDVPMVRYVDGKPIRTLNKLEAVCGPIDASTTMPDGRRVVDYVDGVWQARHAAADLPPLFMLHGRADQTIHWQLNPAFYAAMNQARQGIEVFWNNLGHQDVAGHLPPDVAAWTTFFRKYRLDASFPVFSDNSDNRNYGTGDPADGDLVGWINRGVDWKDVQDTPAQYAITVQADHPEIVYPITVTVSLRRLQQFRIQPGEKLDVRIGQAAPVVLAADGLGLLSIPTVRIADRAGVRITVSKTK